jgi:hypothetical protein
MMAPSRSVLCASRLRADLFAHVIFPSLPIRVPPTPLGYLRPPPIYTPCPLLLQYWHNGTHHVPSCPYFATLLKTTAPVCYQPFPPVPACHGRHFCIRCATHPVCVALAHPPHLHIYHCSCAFLLYTHNVPPPFPPFTFVHPNVLL